MLMRPKRKRNRREIVHHRDGIAIFRQVDRSNIKLASLASLHTNMWKLLRDIHGQFFFFLFPASGTKNPPKLPLMAAKRTDHAALPAVTFEPQHSKQGPPSAQRANSRRRQNRRHRRLSREIRGI